MQDKAISPAGRRARRLARGGVAIALVVLSYYGVMEVVRVHVGARIHASVGRPLPEFSLRDREGRAWTRADLVGRTTVLNVFRSKCHGCVAERAAIRALAREFEHREDVQVLGILTDPIVAGLTEADTARTLRDAGYRHPVLLADGEFVEGLHGGAWAHVTPVTYVIDAKGVIRAALRGHQTLAALRDVTRGAGTGR